MLVGIQKQTGYLTRALRKSMVIRCLQLKMVKLRNQFSRSLLIINLRSEDFKKKRKKIKMMSKQKLKLIEERPTGMR